MENNLYELVKNNEERENELKEERIKEESLSARLLQKNYYANYKFLMQEFIYFVKDIVSRYGNINSNLKNIRLSEINYKLDNNYLKEFLKNNNLGEIKYDVIVWNEEKTIREFIDAYYSELQMCEQYIFLVNDLKTQYIQLLAENKKEYEPLLTDKFKDLITRYTKGINENISYKIYYYLQQKLEEINYSLEEFDTRDYSDYYDDPTTWSYCNPDTTFKTFLNSCSISGYVSMIISDQTVLDLDNLNRNELELLIRDIKTVQMVKEEKKDEPILSRGRAYKEVHKQLN